METTCLVLPAPVTCSDVYGEDQEQYRGMIICRGIVVAVTIVDLVYLLRLATNGFSGCSVPSLHKLVSPQYFL